MNNRVPAAALPVLGKLGKGIIGRILVGVRFGGTKSGNTERLSPGSSTAETTEPSEYNTKNTIKDEPTLDSILTYFTFEFVIN